MAEFDCSGGWTQKEKKEIAALMRLENKLAENEKRLRHDVRRLDEELSAARQSSSGSRYRLPVPKARSMNGYCLSSFAAIPGC